MAETNAFARWRSLGLQVYAGAIVIIAVVLGNDWRVLLAGALALPFLAELVMRPPKEDRRPRPQDWTQADEIVLRARETWQVQLRRAFWVAWLAGWIAGDRISTLAEDGGSKIMVRAGALVASMVLLGAGVFVTRVWMSARAVRQAEAAVKAEGRYPPPR